MKTRKTFEGQKPKRFEGHLVIECPECQADNYISLAEAMTEGFIMSEVEQLKEKLRKL